jgi:hypothetical protein
MKMLAIVAALVAALSFSTETIVRANTDPNPPAQTYEEFAQEHEPWDRKAAVLDKDGKLLKDFGRHHDSPFPNKKACTDGLLEDTANIYTYLQKLGADIETLDVVVTCEPAGRSS